MASEQEEESELLQQDPESEMDKQDDMIDAEAVDAENEPAMIPATLEEAQLIETENTLMTELAEGDKEQDQAELEDNLQPHDDDDDIEPELMKLEMTNALTAADENIGEEEDETFKEEEEQEEEEEEEGEDEELALRMSDTETELGAIDIMGARDVEEATLTSHDPADLLRERSRPPSQAYSLPGFTTAPEIFLTPRQVKSSLDTRALEPDTEALIRSARKRSTARSVLTDQQRSSSAGIRRKRSTASERKKSSASGVSEKSCESVVKSPSEEQAPPQVSFEHRKILVEQFKQAQAERCAIYQRNNQAQHRLAQYFMRRAPGYDLFHFTADQLPDEQQQKYLKHIGELDELIHAERLRKREFRSKKEEIEESCEVRLQELREESERLNNMKREVALSAVHSRSGKSMDPSELEKYLMLEAEKSEEIRLLRLENIKLKNRLDKEEQRLRLKEELSEGLHMIDFEQLKIENQTYNEKIEERNEELNRLRKKIISSVHILSHVKEKLQFVQQQNETDRTQLRQVEALVAKERQEMNYAKQSRDALRAENHKLRQTSGLLGHDDLLEDFEKKTDKRVVLEAELKRLKYEYGQVSSQLHHIEVMKTLKEAV